MPDAYGPSARPAVHPARGRVLAHSDAGEILLLRGWDPGAPESPYRYAGGGAPEPGGAMAAAAAREMRAETRVVGPAGLEPLGVGAVGRAAWRTAEALDEDGTAASETLTTMMRTAVDVVRGGGR
jgi:ADP-ribose pyrophosphatase YjhB (NUDIX family)